MKDNVDIKDYIHNMIFNLISSSVLSVNKADAGMFGVSDVGECTIIPRLCSNCVDVQFIIIYFPFSLFPSTISKIQV